MSRLVLLFGLLTAPAFAGTLSSVTLPDSTSVAGEQLVLNGLGLREKFWFDIYVGGLYLKARSTDGKAIIDADQPKKLVMEFIYSSGVSASKLADTYRDGFKKDPVYAGQTENAEKFLGWLEDVSPGDKMVIEYAPGKGTTLSVKGAAKGTIGGWNFMRLIFGVYIGPNADNQLRTGLLGL